MADTHAPPPPPPPHGANPKSTSGGLPPGNYDIFIVPPHSAGSGFLYLPSLNTQRNSFLAGVGCTLFACLVWNTAVPVLRQWLAAIAASGGAGVFLLVIGVAVVAWAFGKTQGESEHGRAPPSPDAGDAGKSRARGAESSSHSSTSNNNARPPPPRAESYYSTSPPPRQEYAAPPPRHDPPPRQEYAAPPPPPPPREPSPPPPRPKSPPHRPPPTSRQEQPQPQSPNSSAKPAPDAASSWEKAREETRKREEARKRAEELKKLREEALRKKEEAERQARAAAEKLRWEQARAREKDVREREARERMAKESPDQEKREREARERIEREKKAKAQSPTKPATPSANRYSRPTAQTYASTENSTAYDARTVTSASSYTETLSSYAPSVSTARTSPPPEYRGPYSTSDPDKIVIKAVYMYTSAAKKPLSQLVSGENNVTDGLVLRVTTEGLFIDDDVRRVPQREWDVKAWSIKVIESGELKPHNVLRATIRDLEGKRYIFVLPSDQSWKLDVGLARLRKGSQVRSMGMSGIKAPEMKALLGDLGWV